MRLDRNNSSHLNLLPRVISAALFLILAVVIAPTPAHADVPSWLTGVAHDTYPGVPAETKAVILYAEQETTVQPNGDVETLYRRAYLILRPDGKQFGVVGIHFDNETKITWMKAWCLPKEGKAYELKEKDAIEVGDPNSFYSDNRRKVMEIPAAIPGNVIGYEFRQKHRPFFLQDEWWIQDDVPVLRSRFILNLPAGWEFGSKWIHYPEQKPASQTATQIVWAVDHVGAIKEEASMPNVRAVISRMGVTYFPSSGATTALGPTSWEQIGVWFSKLYASQIQPTPEIQQKVKELTANATTWNDKVAVLARYAQSQIRYVDIEIGIGGFQPHTAGDIFKHQYGDCKDKATLLNAMLHEIGVESYLSLAQTERGIVAPEFASAITFNHAILAIRVPEGQDTKDLHSVIDVPKLGKLLIFDPTDPYTPFGYLPTYEQANYILIAAPEGGQLVALPLHPPELNRLVRSAKLQLFPDGSLTGSVEEMRYGAMASNERAMLLGTAGADRSKILENFLSGFLRGFHLTEASTVDLDKVGEPLNVKYGFTAERYAKSAGDLLVVRPRVLGQKSDDVAEGDPRKFPVEFESASTQTDDFEITLPPGFTVEDVPAPTKAESEFASYTSLVKVDGNKIHYTRTYQIKQVMVPLDKLDELKKFNRQIAADERSSVVLHHGTN
jgi:hypothetical protein